MGFQKYNKYLVLKYDDVEKYVTEQGQKWLDAVCGQIGEGRAKDGKVRTNSYIVVNEDMKCAKQVWKLIEQELSEGK